MTRLLENIIEYHVLAGLTAGRVLYVHRMRKVVKITSLTSDIIRLQFPIKLSYAITINKSQGQTFERVGIYLTIVRRSVPRGKAGRRENIRRASHKAGFFKYRRERRFTRNVVYRGVLCLAKVVPDLAEVRAIEDKLKKVAAKTFDVPVLHGLAVSQSFFETDCFVDPATAQLGERDAAWKTRDQRVSRVFAFLTPASSQTLTTH